PCQVPARTLVTIGFIGEVIEIRIVYSAPPRVFAKNVSYVGVLLISAIDFTAPNPANDPAPRQPLLQRNKVPSLRNPYAMKCEVLPCSKCETSKAVKFDQPPPIRLVTSIPTLKLYDR